MGPVYDRWAAWGLSAAGSSGGELKMMSTIGAALLIGFATYCTYQYFFHPLAGIPGPLSARLGLGGWLTSRGLKRDLGWKLKEQHDAHGPVVRIARNTCSIIDPAAVGELYRFGGQFEKTDFYRYFKGGHAEELVTAKNNAQHAQIRRSESPAYAMKVLVGMEEFVESCLDKMFTMVDLRIAASPEKKKKATLDLSRVLQFLALDVIGELSFGRSFGLCEAQKDTMKLVPMIDAASGGACLAGTQPWMGQWLLWYSMKTVGEGSGTAELVAMTAQCVEDRMKQMKDSKESGEERNDMLAKLVQAKHPDGRPYDVMDISRACFAILGAASDTTSISMRVVIKEVVENPKIYEKLQREIDEAFASGQMGSPSSYADATKLEYFQACLKEALRFHPAVPWPLPRRTPEGGAHLSGRYFAEGTELAMSPFVFHRSEAAYGPDAATYRPERWLEADEEQRKLMERNLITFGSGPRICLGRNVSMMEMSKVLPSLFHRYKLSFTLRTAGSPHQKAGRAVDGTWSDSVPWHCNSQWFANPQDFWVDVEERSID